MSFPRRLLRNASPGVGRAPRGRRRAVPSWLTSLAMAAGTPPRDCRAFRLRSLARRGPQRSRALASRFPAIPGTPPVWNTGGIILWQAGHFTDRRRQDVLVTIRRSMMHSEETLLLSGRDGRELCGAIAEISQRGVGGTPFAIADFDGEGLDDAASLHPSILYVLKGTTGRDLSPRTRRGPKCRQAGLWGPPVAGHFFNDTRPAIFGGRSMTGVVRADGSLAWWDALDRSAGLGQRSAISTATGGSKPSASATRMACVATTRRPAT